MSVLYLVGPLHEDQGVELRHEVQAQLNRGERLIELSLAHVSDVDAAGVGELVRAYNLAVAAGGAFRITQVPRRVRDILERVGLFDMLAPAQAASY